MCLVKPILAAVLSLSLLLSSAPYPTRDLYNCAEDSCPILLKSRFDGPLATH